MTPIKLPLLKNRTDDWEKNGFLPDGEVVLFNEARKTDFQALQQGLADELAQSAGLVDPE